MPSGVACERLVLGPQPAGFVRVNLIPYHLALPEVDGRSVLDVGTNEGAGAALFATRAREVCGLDRSEDAIRAARERHRRSNLRFLVHDAGTPLPFPDASMGVVFSSEVIEHLPSGEPLLRSAARVLEPGGVLLLKTPNDDYNRLENRLNPHHVNSYTATRLEAELRRHFTDVVIEGITYDVTLDATPEPMPDGPEDPIASPYRFGDPIRIDRAVVVR
ncbi:MAG TPA: class I SAM-dependent methyltransferase, partial [Candidatus Eisenbacteria bacterium]|nr:class I SAM-dependent methyltransferase [Candidatus Eisenbacteria bacterium]